MTIWLLLSIACFGHTNTECIPIIKQYHSQEECEKARIQPRVMGHFGKVYREERFNPHEVCFQVNGFKE
jgi:hypothetical protein